MKNIKFWCGIALAAAVLTILNVLLMIFVWITPEDIVSLEAAEFWTDLIGYTQAITLIFWVLATFILVRYITKPLKEIEENRKYEKLRAEFFAELNKNRAPDNPINNIFDDEVKVANDIRKVTKDE